MGFYQMRDRRIYWSRDSATSVDFHFSDVMSKATWERIFSVLETPAATAAEAPDEGLNISSQPGELPVAAQPEPATPVELNDRLWKVRGLMQWCVRAWNEHWEPGDVLVADESMLSWAGASEAHISYIPRKPNPLGI